MVQRKKDDSINLDKTFKQGLGGGILGAFVGSPGLGMGLGMAHANKEKLREWSENTSKEFKKLKF